MIWSDPALLRLSVLPLPPAVLLPPAQLRRLHGGFGPGSRSRGTETVGRAPDPARSFARTPVRRYSRVLPGRALQPGDEGMALVRPRPRWCRGGASHGGPIEARVCRATPDTQLSGPRRKLILSADGCAPPSCDSALLAGAGRPASHSLSPVQPSLLRMRRYRPRPSIRPSSPRSTCSPRPRLPTASRGCPQHLRTRPGELPPGVRDRGHSRDPCHWWTSAR
jgi:hypothetical protein